MNGTMVFNRWPPKTCFLGPTSLPIPNGVSIGSAIFAQLTAECPYTLQWSAFPLKIASFLWESGPHVKRDSLGPSKPNTNGISNDSAVFAQLTADCPYTLQWAAPSTLKITPSHGGSGPHLTHGFLGPSESSTQTSSQSVQPFWQGHYCEGPPDRRRYSVCNTIAASIASAASRPNDYTILASHNIQYNIETIHRWSDVI